MDWDEASTWIAGVIVTPPRGPVGEHALLVKFAEGRTVLNALGH